jgi:hypothetical protein
MRVPGDIFTVTKKTDNRDVYLLPLNATILEWLRANVSHQIRNALSRFPPHPLIRSYQVRSILGRTSHKRITHDLESVVLNHNGDRLPNVIGTYSLPRLQLQDPAAAHCLPHEA